jgi:cyclic pyranopterin phosphate synthase
MSKRDLSHIDRDGSAQMVDVTHKNDTVRVARATGAIRMSSDTLSAIKKNTVAKGDVLAVSRVAGIMAGKRTAELIPLCHPLPLTDLQVTLSPDETLPGLQAEAVAKTVGKTGVEMEALTAVAVSLITVYDMVKAIDKTLVISDVMLQEKHGGKGSSWTRE